ncbi:MAG: PepSY domain-containing protein [Xanthomonadales bacterium]|jgi:hypothetical protein|nr:PepSY domain-containing protein [Xanthomonadales bacterium]
MARKTLIALSLAAVIAVPAMLYAATPAGIDLARAVQIAEAAGYRDITDIDREDDSWELTTRGADGRKQRVYIEAATGDILWPAQPGQRQLSAADVMARLAAAGYADIRELERDEGYWSADVRGTAGLSRELRIHPLTGAISEARWDD